MLVISEPERIRQEDLKFKAILRVGKMKFILAYRRNEKMKKKQEKEEEREGRRGIKTKAKKVE